MWPSSPSPLSHRVSTAKSVCGAKGGTDIVTIPLINKDVQERAFVSHVTYSCLLYVCDLELLLHAHLGTHGQPKAILHQ